MLAFILQTLKDAVLCLLICSTCANMGKNKKTAFVSLFIVILLVLMGIDF